MSKRRLTLHTALALFAAAVLVAGPSMGAGAAEQKGGGPEPTVITSESLTADNKAKTALFTGNVVATKGEMKMYADRMLVYYKEGAKGGSTIDRIESTGNVKVTKGARVITSGKAVYHAALPERIIFTESPRAAEGQNMVIGTKMTYYVKDDRSLVENSQVFIISKEQPGDKEQKQDGNSQ